MHSIEGACLRRSRFPTLRQRRFIPWKPYFCSQRGGKGARSGAYKMVREHRRARSGQSCGQKECEGSLTTVLRDGNRWSLLLLGYLSSYFVNASIRAQLHILVCAFALARVSSSDSKSPAQASFLKTIARRL